MHTQDVAPETGKAAPPETALHGRRDELERIGDLLRGARRSQSAVLVLRGPAGIGKSALLAQARAAAADMQVLACRGTESEARLPFAALHQLLRPVLDRADAIPAIQARALRCALGLEFGSRREPFLVSLAVLSVLAEAAERRPLLCVVDDAQWLDEATADALRFVARRLDAEPVAMLLAAREEPDEGLRRSRGRATARRRARRAGRGTRSSIAPAAGRSRPSVARVARRTTTDGNPLALIELSRRR